MYHLSHLHLIISESQILDKIWEEVKLNSNEVVLSSG